MLSDLCQPADGDMQDYSCEQFTRALLAELSSCQLATPWQGGMLPVHASAACLMAGSTQLASGDPLALSLQIAAMQRATTAFISADCVIAALILHMDIVSDCELQA